MVGKREKSKETIAQKNVSIANGSIRLWIYIYSRLRDIKTNNNLHTHTVAGFWRTFIFAVCFRFRENLECGEKNKRTDLRSNFEYYLYSVIAIVWISEENRRFIDFELQSHERTHTHIKIDIELNFLRNGNHVIRFFARSLFFLASSDKKTLIQSKCDVNTVT